MKKIIFLFFGLFFSASVFATSFDQIVFFGDSLTDNGNLYHLYNKLLPPSPPYYQGRFSNGQTWAERVDKYYYDKSYTAGENYAVGGATALPDTIGNSTSSLQAEVDNYLNDSVLEDKKRTAYFIWIGANDYLNDSGSDQDALTDAVVAKISAAVETSLVANGANKIFVMNLPDLAKTPYAKKSGSDVATRLHIFTVKHNEKLAAAMQKIQQLHPGIHLVTVDIYSMFDDIMVNPDKYHIKNVTDDCLVDALYLPGSNQEKAVILDAVNKSFAAHKKSAGLPDNETIAMMIMRSPDLSVVMHAVAKPNEIRICSDAKQHLFWDAVHPSETTHEVLAGVIEKQLDELG